MLGCVTSVIDSESLNTNTITSIEQEFLDSPCLLNWAIVIGNDSLKLEGYSICTMQKVIPNFELFIVNSVTTILGGGLIGVDVQDVLSISENTNWTCSTILNADNFDALRMELRKVEIPKSAKVKGVLFAMSLPVSGTLLTVEEIHEVVNETLESEYNEDVNIIFASYVIPDNLAEQGVPASVMVCWEK